jgi:hypothetical protein
VTNDNGGTKAVGDFGIATNAGALSFGAGVGTTTKAYTSNQLTVNAGTYTLSENNVAGYTEGTWSCTGNAGAVVSTFSAGSVVVGIGETVTCSITNNDDPAHLILIKHVDNGGGAGKVASQFILNVSGVTFAGSPSVTGAESPGVNETLTSVGSYNVTEPADPDYVTSYSADCNSSIALNETKTCTITNTRRGKITITKDSIPDDAQDFVFTLDGNGSTLTLDDDVDGTHPNTDSFTGLSPNTHTVSEGSVSGWDLTNIVCTGASYTYVGGQSPNAFLPGTTIGVSVTVPAGGTANCTFTNTKRASITIVKDVVPNDGTAWNFGIDGDDPGTGGADTGSDWDRTVTGLTEAAGAHPETLLKPGNYSVSETTNSTYLTSVSCNSGKGTDSDGSISFALNAGDNVTCTFTNTKKAKVIVHKATLPNTDTTTQFGFTGGLGAFSLTNGGTAKDTGFTLTPGVGVTITEGSLTDWVLTSVQCTGSGVVNVTNGVTITPVAGGTVDCTFNNTKNGAIIVRKEINTTTQDNPSFSFAGINGFTYSASRQGGQETAPFAVAPGTYQVQEGLLAGWDLKFLTCDDAAGATDSTGDVPSRTATFKVDPGETVKCTFTNRKETTITIEKQTLPDTNATPKFTFTGPGAQDSVQLGDDETKQYVIEPGDYDISEADLAGWKLTGLLCNDSDSGRDGETSTARVHAAVGEAITCVFTNTELGSLTINKVTIPASDAQDFTFTGDPAKGNLGTSVLDTEAGDKPDSASYNGLLPGLYSLTEGTLADWDLTDLTCDSEDDDSIVSKASGNVTIDLNPGENVSCTFTNTKRGKIIVAKVTDPATDTTTDFNFTPSWDSNGFQLSGGETNSSLHKPGQYSVSEVNLPAGWDLTSAVCTSDDPTNEDLSATGITLGAGETVTCVFTNTQRGHIAIEKQTLPNGSNRSFEFTPNYGSPFSLSDGGTNNSAALVPGTYNVAESATAGWDLTSAVCDDGSPVTAISLQAGETVTCVFTNTQRAHLTINKVVVAQPLLIENGTFDLQLDGSTKAGAVGNGGTTGVMEVPAGNHSVGETGAGATNLGNYTASITCGAAGSGSVGQISLGLNLAPGATVVCTITNTRNPVLDTPALVVNKFNDPLGNKTGSGGTLDGWTITITGTSGPALGHTFSAVTGALAGSSDNGRVRFDGIFEGTYSVGETPQAGWQVIGSRLNGGNEDNDAIRDGAQVVTVLAGQSPVVDFYNRALVTIEVQKTETSTAGSKAGQGWTFTLSGCGITPIVKTTGADGKAIFSNLFPALGCSYTVTESTQQGWTVVPSASQTVSPQTGGTVTIFFNNIKNEPGCFPNCQTTQPTPAPTPPTPVPPTATNTSAPAAPTSVSTVQGERTPGPTPKPPATGAGFGTPVGSANAFMAFVGLLVISLGLGVIAMGRNKRTR